MFVAASDRSKNLKYYASTREGATNLGDKVQSWLQVLRRDGKVHFREGHPKAKVSELSAVDGSYQPHAVELHPIRDSFDFASRFSRASNVDCVELFSTSEKSKLQAANYDKKGNLICRWLFNSTQDLTIEAHAVLEKSAGFMPSRAAFYALKVDDGGTERSRRLLSEVRTTWKRQGGIYVPAEISAVDRTSNAGIIENIYEAKFVWRIDGEVYHDFDVLPASEEWRKPLQKVFEGDLPYVLLGGK